MVSWEGIFETRPVFFVEKDAGREVVMILWTSEVDPRSLFYTYRVHGTGKFTYSGFTNLQQKVSWTVYIWLMFMVNV